MPKMENIGPAMKYLPLYIAFFLSVMAITFSIRTYNSTHFVVLERPIRVSPYLKSIRYVGLSSWELCAIEQDGLDKIIERVGVGYAGEDTAPVMIELHSHVVPTTDLQTNTTTYVHTTYHFSPHALETSAAWFEAPVHDDILGTSTFPYIDDDSFQASFPPEYWSCHTLRFNSRTIVNDRLWILARISFAIGTMIGFMATILLTFLLVLRAKDVDELRRRQDDYLERGSSRIHLLDTNTSGCRQISACFLIAYLMQCLTLLFLNGSVCVRQKCSISSGARSLIASCILWVICALLLTLMLEKGRKDQKKLRQLRRRVVTRIGKRPAEEDSGTIELRENIDDSDVLDTTCDTAASNDDSDTSDTVQKEDV